MDARLDRLYRTCPSLPPGYVRNVLGLSGAQAESVDKINGGIHREEAELLAAVTQEVDPAVSVEIGLGYGFSALAICAAGARAKDTRRHIVIDPHQHTYWGDRGLRHLEQAGFLDMVELRAEASYRALPQLEAEGVVADLAFIDGWHTFDFVFVDFFYLDKIVRPGGVIAFDDADWPSVRPVLRFAVSNLGYEPVATLPEERELNEIDARLGVQGSLVALRKPLWPRKREIFFHEPF